MTIWSIDRVRVMSPQGKERWMSQLAAKCLQNDLERQRSRWLKGNAGMKRSESENTYRFHLEAQ